MRTAERLIIRLRKIGLDLPEGSRLERTHAGYWQRKQGAWTWRAIGPGNRPLWVGSTYTMTELLAAPGICAHRDGSDTSIDIVA